MSEFRFFVGIDISKKYFDAAVLHYSNPAVAKHQCFNQSQKGYTLFVNWLMEQGCTLNNEVLICMEHTGIYINGLAEFLVTVKASMWIEMPLKIKRTIGLQRGGDDKLAAINIAQYAYRFKDKATLWKPMDTAIERLRNLVAQRDRLITSLSRLTVPISELEECGNTSQIKELKSLQKTAVTGLQKSIKAVEDCIDDLISDDRQICKVVNQVSSVKGIGKQTAVALFVYTRGFTMFQTSKQLACYCGVVPFTKSSGSSVRYKSQVSPYANRKLKKLLHLCAMAALRFDKGLHEYYKRKVAEGKNKMSVINAIRNKLLLRIFAVVRDDRNYVDNFVHPCV